MHIFLSMVCSVLLFAHGVLSLSKTVRVFELNPNFDHRCVTKLMFLRMWRLVPVDYDIEYNELDKLEHIGANWI